MQKLSFKSLGTQLGIKNSQKLADKNMKTA
jgi:hypothetical protein